MARYIDADRLIFADGGNNNRNFDFVLRMQIDNAETIDAELVRHGHWIDGFDTDGVLIDYDCSVCNMANDDKTEYCPNCGAKMDEKENEK